MREREPNRKLVRLVMSALFGIFVVAGGIATAYAQQDDDDALPDEKFMRALLRNLGLRNGQEAGIEYKERPPLVLPPTRALPPPGSGVSLAKKNPAWPDDPDIKKAKAAAKAKSERKPIGYYELEVPDERGTLVQSITPQGNPTSAAVPQRAGASQLGTGGNAELTNDELGYKTTLWENITTFGGLLKSDKPESKTFVREPQRSALTDPPAGYRTPSPAQPYGLNQKDSGVQAKGYQDPQTVRSELPQ